MANAALLRRNRKPKPTNSSSSQPIVTQLVAAIRCNDFSVFSSLLETPDLDVNRRTPQGDLPLVESCRFARLEMATLLLSSHKANVNAASSNCLANRVGLTPLIAACMALEPKIVALLLSQSQKKVNLLQTFGRINAATVLLLFCVANGRTDEQNDLALQILDQLLTYAKQQNQLKALLTAKPDQVNSLVHVAAGAGNWKALRMLREYADDCHVDFTIRNAAEHSSLRVVEMNAFQARSLQFCEPPRSRNDSKKGRQRTRKKKEDKQENERQENKDEGEKEPLSEADKQTFTRTRPDRNVEAFHVTRTVLELVKDLGPAAIFSRKSDVGLRGLYIKTLVLAEVGLVRIVNELARMPDTMPMKSVYVDGLMCTIASVYPLALKNAKEYQSPWHQALRTTGQGDEEGTSRAKDELSLEAFQLIMSRMLSYNSLAKRVKVWTLVLMHLLRPYDSKTPLAADMKPVMEECSQLTFYERIAEMLFRSGTKLAFSIFDRTDIEDDESYDEEIEFHLLISFIELFFKFFTPYARTICAADSPESLRISSSFQRAIRPIKQLWSLLDAALKCLDDVIATPQRFSLLLHLLQVFEQLEAAFDLDEEATLKKLYELMSRFVKQEAKKKRLKTPVIEQSHLLHTIAAAFPIPSSLIDKVISLKASVDVLIRSDPKILGMDLYSFASIPGIVRLEHKVDYLSMLAEERSGILSISISRTSEANYVDFILQQILSTSGKQLKGELNITLVNEPGVGVGITREFFQIVQRCFFQAGATERSHVHTVPPAPHVLKIGAQWLQLARTQSLQNENSDKTLRIEGEQSTQSFTELFPFFDYVDEQEGGVIAIAPRPIYISKQIYDAKRSIKSLNLSQAELLVNPAEVNALKKIYVCLGRLMGLAIRNHQPLGVNFPIVFWKFMMRDGSLAWEDYCENSSVFKNSLQSVLDHDFDVEPMDMRFEYTVKVTVVDENAKMKKEEATTHEAGSVTLTTNMEMELQVGVGEVQVTNANKAEYVLLRAQQFFFGNEVVYYKKMRDGFTDIIARSDLKLFRPEELQRLVCGELTIDFKDLKKSVVYSRGVKPSRGVVQRFWKVVETFDQVQRAKLLTFWSGSSRPPIFGFDSKYRSMNADTACWYIDVDTGMDRNFCPMANTCDRRLILPDYPTTAILREKLLVALEHGSIGYDRM
ncbi:hect domain-containing [Plasmopara halstedii]|uniref:E3 ubiquitin-protein ligase HACE1 n=1 Tax=Plasmopara halstedii TaxID=4781 RepID=A0A0P1A816_PLAHL|nr:hect domain-containing [Plasmopara halstedii]CEG36397.1 hect domain-containing [Plasmopara halstedii]|eukprot:XP_024572766.1 hect domain-containing [Plasmopara halstedii]